MKKNKDTKGQCLCKPIIEFLITLAMFIIPCVAIWYSLQLVFKYDWIEEDEINRLMDVQSCVLKVSRYYKDNTEEKTVNHKMTGGGSLPLTFNLGFNGKQIQYCDPYGRVITEDIKK